MIIPHKTYLPSFALGLPDQAPVCIYTLLSVNESVGDCAAYRGVGPDASSRHFGVSDDVLERIRAGGTKISETEARDMFPEIDANKWKYRR